VYAHAGLVSYQGEKMSKSLGNLVFVNRLLAEGTNPMAIRLVLLAHHYRSGWEWTDAVLADAVERLSRWRAAVILAGSPRPPSLVRTPSPAQSADAVLAGMRDRLADDLDAPGALTIVDAWADAVLTGEPTASSDAGLVRDAADALLGIAL
jgi:L-cysteine:1D-myo-inositol 2-amino-2-deoxy-alpha-D-glucopyranoside ligase